jgi:hypothetical protein
MSDVGFSSLSWLKGQVLPSEKQEDTEWDTMIAQIGRHVATMFANKCNRRFKRVASATYQRSADCSYLVLPRYPVESVASVQWRATSSDSWETVTDDMATFGPRTGVIEFSRIMGTERNDLLVTYTGGYWWDETEDDSDTLPSGATEVPDDLRGAWTEQVQAIMEARGILGVVGASVPLNDVTGGRRRSLEIELLQSVRDVLMHYRRFT